MRRFKPLLWLLALACLPAAGQAVRFSSNAYTINSSAPLPGGLYPVLSYPGAAVTICNYSATSTCPSVATTFTDATGTVACPTTAQLTPPGSAACTGTADAQGIWGGWIAGGTYQAVITTAYGTFGPYAFSVGGGGSGSGVTSLNSLTGAVAIACGTGLSCNVTGQTLTISAGATFSITSFTGGETVELGTSVANPTFHATYSTTPASANITNTEGIGSPLTLSTPFTSGTVSGTFVHTTTATTTFILSATLGTTQTATQTISWQPAIFGGVGSSGATSSVTASGTTAVLSTGDVLPRIQLGAETVGQTLGSYNPSGQVLYLLLTGGSHTFIDANTGFPFAFNSPVTVSFVNAQGVTVTMYLYASTNALYGNYVPKVAS